MKVSIPSSAEFVSVMNSAKLRLMSERIIFGCALLCLGIFITTSFNTFYWMDDFWKRYELLHSGFFQFQWDIYWSWDGRALSPVYTLRNFFLLLFDYPQSWVVSLITMSFLLGTSYFVALIFLKENWQAFSWMNKVTIVLTIAFVLVMAFRPHLSRSFYWATGSFYTIANFFCIYSTYRLIQKPTSNMNYWWFYVSISTGSNSGVLMLCFLVLAQWSGTIKLFKSKFMILFFIGIVTLCFVTFAPGNFQRANGGLVFTISSLVEGGLAIFREYSGMSKWVGIGAILLGIYLGRGLPKFDITLVLIFAICALASILAFLPMPSAASKHTAIHFQTFFLLAGTFGIAYIIRKLKDPVPVLFSNQLAIIFFLFFGYEIWTQIITGRMVYDKMMERFEIFENNRGYNGMIKVKSISIPKNNWTSTIWDMTSDPMFYSNIYVEKYFDIKEVAIGE